MGHVFLGLHALSMRVPRGHEDGDASHAVVEVPLEQVLEFELITEAVLIVSLLLDTPTAQALGKSVTVKDCPSGRSGTHVVSSQY